MENLVTDNAYALPLFFTEDIFVVEDKSIPIVEEKIAKDNGDDIAFISQGDESKSIDYSQEINKESLVSEPEPNISFEFLGKNKRQILILVNDGANEVSTESGNALLKKILKAAAIGKDDFGLVNIAKQANSSFAQLNVFFKPRVMIAFGVDALSLDLQKDEVEKTIARGDISLVFSKNLDVLDTDAAAKKLLWEDLKSCTF